MEKRKKYILKEHHIQFPQRLNRDESGQYWKSLNLIISTVSLLVVSMMSTPLTNYQTKALGITIFFSQTDRRQK